ncbi:branched-chain amino acid ABC transporter substrate-binding protein [Sideroxydans lithotrophicus]|uniref:Extracellular ligand-binding receptor n=1 Tax=Sideroxydans lithotrophicus (strain ES-1) TaxID=580332 RepID=D5CNZ6_SIDLE|nr:branched-chain amino acid ABC transporter substrate-binding protein [Sideroxydans lithotrophicus]ADE12917.1 Extracellular ligand-binding receptor [Sideroxydans lithotrophicus ES-1]
MLINKFPLAVVLCVAFVGCGKTESPSSQAANSDEITVKIGAAGPLTGPQAHIGKDNENGTRMAIDDANARGVMIGGKKAHFELLSEDDQTDPKTATIVAQKLVDDKVNGVIGHLNSGTSIPASAIYFKNGIPQISPSATAVKFTAQGYNTAFRVMTNDAQQGKALGEFAAKVVKAKKIAVIDDRTAYGQGLADEFVKSAEANGAQIIAREYTTDHSVDFTAVLTSIKGKQPDLLFFGGMDPQGVPMVKQLRALDMKTQFMMGDGGYTPKLIELAGGAAEGTYASLPGVPLDSMPSGRDFAKRYEERFHQPIQLYAPYCYDAVNVMIAAMQKAGSAEPAKYLPEIGKVELNGVTAKIAFDEKGDIKGGAVTVYQVHKDQWHAVQTMGGEPAAKL